MKSVIESFGGITTAFSDLFAELNSGDWFALLVFPFNLLVALFGVAWAVIELCFYWIKFFVLACLALPAMFIMAKWYGIWEKWIKESKDIALHADRMILIIPFSIVIFIGMIFYGVFHPPFEEMIKNRYGKKPF
jgi:hypothetical protein